VNGHDLDGICAGACRSGTGPEAGPEVLRFPATQAAAARRAREEITRASPSSARGYASGLPAVPNSPEPVCRRSAVASLERPGQHFAHAREAHLVMGCTACQAPAVASASHRSCGSSDLFSAVSVASSRHTRVRAGGKPGAAVAEIVQRPSELHQSRTIGRSPTAPGPRRALPHRRPQHIHDRNGVRVCRHQHRHARVAVAAAQLADARGDRPRLGVAVTGKQAQLHAGPAGAAPAPGTRAAALALKAIAPARSSSAAGTPAQTPRWSTRRVQAWRGNCGSAAVASAARCRCHARAR